MQRFGSLGMVAATQLQKMSLVSKVMCGIILFLYFLSYIPGVKVNLAVTPAYIGPPNVKIWTLATAAFYESSIILVFLDIAALTVLSAFLEPLWGAKEFMVFTSIVGVVSLVSGVFISVLGYAITRSYSVMFSSYHGLAPVVCGYIVAVKQLHPDSVPLPPPVPPTLRVKHMPVMLVLVSLLFSIIHLVPFAFFWLVLSGCVVSWTYLRFYQKKEQGGRGDMAEGFAFATFFPEAIQPVLATMSGFIFHLLVSVRVCPKTVRTYDVGSASTIKVSLPGADSADAQRRKQRALKALDERLKKTNEPTSWPSMEDAGSSSGPEDPTPAVKPSASGTMQLEAVVVDKVPSKTVSPVGSAANLAPVPPSD